MTDRVVPYPRLQALIEEIMRSYFEREQARVEAGRQERKAG